MECPKVKELLPVYLDNELDPQKQSLVKGHLSSCPACRQEAQLLEKTWDMLGADNNIEPEPGYVSRFWTALSMEKTASERMIEGFKNAFFNRRLAPALAAAAVVIIVGLLSLRTITQPVNGALANLDPDEIEMLENFEIVQNFDIIENIDLYEDLEVIENLDVLESI